MSAFDMHHRVKQAVALQLAAISSNTTTVGEIIDTQGFESLEFIVQVGTITDGAYALLLEESDASNMSGATAVTAEETLGVLTGFVAADDDTAKRVGTIGKKRFQRLSIVTTGVTTGVDFIGAVAVQGHPFTAPTAE